MNNFRKHLVSSAVMAALTATFGKMVYTDYGLHGHRPGDIRTIIVGLILVALISVSVYLLGTAIEWLILVHRFKREFGFKPPNDPLLPGYQHEQDHLAVQATLTSIHRYNSVKKYKDTAALAEKFGFIVNWPQEYRER